MKLTGLTWSSSNTKIATVTSKIRKTKLDLVVDDFSWKYEGSNIYQ